MSDPKHPNDPAKRSFPWSSQTEMVHGGTLRSQFGETSEAIFATSGYVYDSAEQAAARFTEEDKGFTYSRFENPTVEMFEQRMALLEGAPAARATASGMAGCNRRGWRFAPTGTGWQNSGRSPPGTSRHARSTRMSPLAPSGGPRQSARRSAPAKAPVPARYVGCP